MPEIHQVGVRVTDLDGNLGVITDGGVATDADYILTLDKDEVYEVAASQVTPVPGHASRLGLHTPARDADDEETWYLHYAAEVGQEVGGCESCDMPGEVWSVPFQNPECTVRGDSKEELWFCQDCILEMVLAVHQHGLEYPGTYWFAR